MSISKPIYLDYAATTPVDSQVAEKMLGCLQQDGVFGNPASRSHEFGWKAEELVEKARGQVADLLGADSREIVWTAGATEANNLAIKGAAHFYAEQKGKHIVTTAIEHKSVLDPCRFLEGQGFEVTYAEPDKYGVVSPESIAAAIREDTVLVSVMHANNEIGSVNDLAAIGKITRERGVLFASDIAQSLGKLPIDVNEMNVDLLAMSAHKIYGPKGIGALYIRRRPRVRLETQMHGGGHERGLRSGTLPTHQIVGFGEACRVAKQRMEEDAKHFGKLRQRFLDKIGNIEQVFVNGHPAHHLPGTLNISINYVEGESLMMALNDVAISSGSACTSASLEPSYVLRALGLSDELAHSSLRFTFGRYTTEDEVDYVAGKLCEAIKKLRQLSPLWEMYKKGVNMDEIQWAEH